MPGGVRPPVGFKLHTQTARPFRSKVYLKAVIKLLVIRQAKLDREISPRVTDWLLDCHVANNST